MASLRRVGWLPALAVVMAGAAFQAPAQEQAPDPARADPPERDDIGPPKDPDAGPLSADISISFPGQQGTRTIVQALLSLPVEGLQTTREASGDGFFDIVLHGEIQRRTEPFEEFRYHYRLPATAAEDGVLPVLFERNLRPGAWRLVLHVDDGSGDRLWRTELPFDVPAFSTERRDGPGATPAAAVEPSIEILPLPRELITGRLRVAAAVEGEGVAAVEFWHDGRSVMRKTRPPYSVDLDFGRTPRTHVVRVVALDAQRQPLAVDEAILNGGANRLSVRLLEPRAGRTYTGILRAVARVDVPPGEELDRVELYANEHLLATLFQPPFSLPVTLPPGEEVAWVEARACLAGERCQSDLVFVQTPAHLERLDVHTVELYATVTDRRGRVIDDLRAEDVRVREEGVEHELRRFEHARERHSHSVLLIDLSGSIAESLIEVERAALGFFEEVLSPKDRCAVMTFADDVELVVPFTDDLEVLRGGLADVSAEGYTALWDGVIHALHYLGGLQGRQALIVISDGEDTASGFGFDQALEFASRADVTIYPIFLGRPTRPVQARGQLGRLATASGGRLFEIERASGLAQVYAAIEAELRSQYLLVYQSQQTEGDEFREVEVEVLRPGHKARTISGYYP